MQAWDPNGLSHVISRLQDTANFFRQIIDVDHMQSDARLAVDDAFEWHQRAAEADIQMGLFPDFAPT